MSALSDDTLRKVQPELSSEKELGLTLLSLMLDSPPNPTNRNPIPPISGGYSAANHCQGARSAHSTADDQ